MALKVNDPAPDFKLATMTGEAQGEFNLSAQRGKNVVIFFYALDFTPVCHNEMADVQKQLAEFAARNAEVVGINTDTIFAHKAFQKELGGLSYPLASDRWPYADTAQAYGIFPPKTHPFQSANDRAVFIIDKQGKIAWSKVYDLGQQPDLKEILAELNKLA